MFDPTYNPKRAALLGVRFITFDEEDAAPELWTLYATPGQWFAVVAPEHGERFVMPLEPDQAVELL